MEASRGVSEGFPRGILSRVFPKGFRSDGDGVRATEALL